MKKYLAFSQKTAAFFFKKEQYVERNNFRYFCSENKLTTSKNSPHLIKFNFTTSNKLLKSLTYLPHTHCLELTKQKIQFFESNPFLTLSPHFSACLFSTLRDRHSAENRLPSIFSTRINSPSFYYKTRLRGKVLISLPPPPSLTKGFSPVTYLL